MPRKKNYKECLVSPLKSTIRNFNSIVNFYMYYAPNINSAQSRGRIENQEASRVLKKMLSKTNMDKTTRFLKIIQPQSWVKANLESDVIDFESLRILCNKMKNETELTALLRHIRNAFAHGYIYVWKKKRGTYVILVDFDRQKNKRTAMILVTYNILEQWKAILENEMPTGE